MQLRPYQHEAVESTLSYLKERKGNPCIIAPTASGKSLILAELTKRFEAPTLILSHRKEILEQNEDKLRRLAPMLQVGMYSASLGRKEIKPVTIAQIQSIARRSTSNILEVFKYVVIDEAHLIPKNEDTQYQKVIKACVNASFIGLTASPMRLDSGAIVGDNQIFNGVSYEIKIKELLKDGYISPLVGKSSVVQADLSDVQKRGGEYILEQARKKIDVDSMTIAAIQECLKYAKDRKAWIIFASGVEHAQKVSNAFGNFGISNHVITGDTLPLLRDKYISEFKNNKVRALINCDVLCLDEHTEILSRQGWQTIDSILPEHDIACWDEGKIFFAKPENIVKRWRGKNEKMVSLKSNAVDIRVTANHRMVVYQGLNKKTRITPADSLVGKPANLPAIGDADPELFKHAPRSNADKKKIRRKIVALKHLYKKKYNLSSLEAEIRASKEVLRKEELTYLLPHELSLEMCELIGFWIGDGSRGKNKSSGAEVITLSQSLAYPKNIKRINYLLGLCNIPFNKKIKKPASKSKNESILWILCKGTGSQQQSRNSGTYKIDPYLDKNGSDMLWGLNKKQFQSLLKGFWMADGLHHSSYTRNSITNTNKRLLDLLQSIATCRGIRNTVRQLSQPKKNNHNQQWIFSWDFSAKKVRTYKKRFILEDEYQKERAWCVTSKTGTLITRRNGRIAVVGNTTGFDSPNVDCIILLRATASTSLYIQILGRGMRICEGKKDCLVLDFCGNLERHGPIDLIDYRNYFERKKGDGEAPGKICPECKSLVHASALECLECGFVFPEREVKHEKSASEGEPLSINKIEPPREWLVTNITPSIKNSSKGGEPMLVVNYECGLNIFKEFICFDHVGFAREMACRWWRDRAIPGTVPVNSEDAFHRFDELYEPKSIWTKKETVHRKNGMTTFDKVIGITKSGRVLREIKENEEILF